MRDEPYDFTSGARPLPAPRDPSPLSLPHQLPFLFSHADVAVARLAILPEAPPEG